MIENLLKLVKTLAERAENYSVVYPQRPPLASNGRWLYGVWIIGNARGHPKELYGAYPGGYLKRIQTIFPDATTVLHLFSGTVEKGLWISETKFDISNKYNPDIIGDARKIDSYFAEEEFELVIADPPYEKSDFERYAVKPFSKHHVLKRLHKIVQKGGYVVWLDTRMPMYSKKEWLLVGTIGIIVSTNTRFRLCSIFQKVTNE
ncbi:MAG: hypothetical protein WC365_09890 [Candidatus Babeliales bacterium]|jgi:hypothetical protein